MFKTTLTCVVVNLIIVHSCLATSNPSGQPESNIRQGSSAITNSLLKQSKVSESYINLLLHSTKGFISQECNDKQGILSSLLSHSMESMFKKFIEGYKTRLAEVRMPPIPGFYYPFLNETSYLKIKLRNIILQDLDTLSISKLEYDVCKLSSEIDIKLPKVYMKSTYTLHGQIGNFPITGDGEFKMYIESANYYEKSFINCKSNIFSGEGCHLMNLNITTDVGVKRLMASVNGVNYRDMSQSQVHDALDHYINNNLKFIVLELKRRVADMILKYKDEHSMMNLNPLKILTKMREDLKKVPNLIKQGNMSLPLSSTDVKSYLNFISTFL